MAAVADAQVHQLGVVTMVISQVSGSQHSKGNLEVEEQTVTLPQAQLQIAHLPPPNLTQYKVLHLITWEDYTCGS